MSHAAAIVAVDGDLSRNEVEDAVDHQMKPFDERGAWFRDGSRWDYWMIGGRYDGWIQGENIIRRHNIDTEELRANKRDQLRQQFRTAQDMSKQMRELLYNIEPGETVEEFVARKMERFPTGLSAYTFVAERDWHERQRLGWFGGSAKTECEIETGERPNICLFEHDDMDARIISWESDEDEWQAKFWDRFIADLPGPTWLAAVDYHV